MKEREASVATLRRLAEALDAAFARNHEDRYEMRLGPHVKAALDAYRSEIAPLRTETEVVLDIGHHIRACVRMGQVMMTAEEKARLEELANEHTAPRSSSGPSSADAEEVPSPRPPASPAGAVLLPWRVGRKVGRTIYDAGNELIGVMDSPDDARRVVDAMNASGSPGAVAAKESRDNAAAPEGAALDACGCEEADRLNGYLKDIKFLHRQWSDEKGLAGSILTQIGNVVLRWTSNLP